MALPVIPFSRPYRSAHELDNVARVLESGHVHGDGVFTASASARIAAVTSTERVLLTSSGTHALDMASLLLDLGPGDEVIMPSFTFPSAATAIVLTGATPVFVDVHLANGNIDVEQVEAAITPKTKAISVVHYGGVAVDLDALLPLAQRHGLPIIEDNAHGLGGQWKSRKLGSLGALAAQSFHDTKNVQSGEGGALLINDPALVERAEVIREKGTNRSRFLRGQVDKYTWTDVGSSYLMSELSAAVLDSQLAEFDAIQAMRHSVWDRYASGLAPWAESLGAELMSVPDDRRHTAHLFYVLMPDRDAQTGILSSLRENAVIGTFHYIPLDSSPAGVRYGRTPVPCERSLDFSSRLVRLPLWAGMTDSDVTRVIEQVTSFQPAAVR